MYQHRKGRWVAAISLGGGKRKCFYCPTQAEAVMALHLAHQAKMQGILTGTRNETVETFLLNWLQYRVQHMVRERSYLVYCNVVTKHLLPTLGQIALQKLTPLHVQQLYEMKLSQGYSPQMIHQIHKVLRAALDDAVQLDHLYSNVCEIVTLPPVPRRERSQALTLQQSQQFFKMIRERQADQLDPWLAACERSGIS